MQQQPVGVRNFGSLKWLHVLCGLLVAACAGLPSAGEFIVKDSGVRADRGIRLFWLNNDEVLFGGPAGETRQLQSGAVVPINRVSVWNVRTNQVRRYGEITSSLCYYDGYVVFWESDETGKRLWINSGRLGETTRVERGPDQGEFDRTTCRPVAELTPRPDWTKGLAGYWLKPEHGFLLLGSAEASEYLKNTPIRYCPRGERAQCIELPIKRRETLGFQWVPFKGAYFAVGHYFQVDPRHSSGGFGLSPWPSGIPMPVWWLHPDGRLEEIRLPPGKWLQSTVVPTAVGFATTNTYASVGEAGFFLIRSAQAIRILEGRIHQLAVSPDGCHVAVIHDPRPLEVGGRSSNRVRLKAVELCKGG